MPIHEIANKELAKLFETGRSAKIQASWHTRILAIFDFLDVVESPEDCVGVRDFHVLKGDRKDQYAMSVTGNWRIIFTFGEDGITILSLEDYH